MSLSYFMYKFFAASQFANILWCGIPELLQNMRDMKFGITFLQKLDNQELCKVSKRS